MFKRIWEEFEALAPKPDDSATPRPADEHVGSEPISQLVLSLPRNDTVRHLATALLAGQKMQIPDARPILTAVLLAKPHQWRRGVVAAWCLGRVGLTEQDRRLVAAQLASVVDNQAPNDFVGTAFQRVLKVSGTITGLLTLGGLILAASELRGSPIDWLFGGLAILTFGAVLLLIMIGAMVSPFLIPISVSADKSKFNRIRAQAAEILGALELPESVDVLARAARETTRVHRAAFEALVHVLPRVPEHARGMLSSDTVPNLCHLLDYEDTMAALTILRALERVGDGRAVKPLERRVPEWPDGPLQSEAERILPVLRERLRRETASSVLLRAAGDTDPEVLVRPVITNSPDDPATLMRPADSP